VKDYLVFSRLVNVVIGIAKSSSFAIFVIERNNDVILFTSGDIVSFLRQLNALLHQDCRSNWLQP